MFWNSKVALGPRRLTNVVFTCKISYRYKVVAVWKSYRYEIMSFQYIYRYESRTGMTHTGMKFRAGIM